MIKLLDHLYQIKLGYVNAFLIVEENGLTLIDTGLKNGHKGILKGLETQGYQPSDIKNIIITHSHMDHVGSLNTMKALTDAKIITHPATNEMIKTGDTGLKDGTLKNNIINGLLKFILVFNKFKIKHIEYRVTKVYLNFLFCSFT
jgi:glyoxylase-like metal-dependent hydrolase (beta-lactamase superfamily II)